MKLSIVDGQGQEWVFDPASQLFWLSVNPKWLESSPDACYLKNTKTIRQVHQIFGVRQIKATIRV